MSSFKNLNKNKNITISQKPNYKTYSSKSFTLTLSYSNVFLGLLIFNSAEKLCASRQFPCKMMRILALTFLWICKNFPSNLLISIYASFYFSFSCLPPKLALFPGPAEAECGKFPSRGKQGGSRAPVTVFSSLKWTV